MSLQLSRPLVIFDVEATGLNISSDRIVEIALVKLSPDGTEKSKSVLINPGCPIPDEVIAIHQITNEMVKSSPTFKEVANEIKQFIHHCDLGGFNCLRFDIPILMEEFTRAGIPFHLQDHKIIDVQKIFHIMEPRDLPAAYSFYCKEKMEGHHRAEADAKHTLAVLKAQIDRYDNFPKNPADIEMRIGGFQSLDAMNRVVMQEQSPVFNFGKHKGKKVKDVFKDEPQYYDWVMKSDFSLHTKQVLSELYTKFILSGQS